MDEVHRAGQGDNLHRLVANIEIKGGVLRGHDIPERRGGLDDRICAFIENTHDPKGHVNLDRFRLRCDELELRRPAKADPDIVGHDDLGLALLVRIESVLDSERRIPDRGYPVVLIRYETQQLAFHGCDTANNDLAPGAGRKKSTREKDRQKNDTVATRPLLEKGHMISPR